jgi:hypothetical protein
MRPSLSQAAEVFAIINLSVAKQVGLIVSKNLRIQNEYCEQMCPPEQRGI